MEAADVGNAEMLLVMIPVNAHGAERSNAEMIVYVLNAEIQTAINTVGVILMMKCIMTDLVLYVISVSS